MGSVLQYMKKNIYIFYIVFTNSLGFTCLGSGLSWASPSLAKLEGPNPPMISDSSDRSSIAAFLAIGAMAAAIPYTVIFNKFGRKWLITTLACIHIIGWIILIFSTRIWHLCLGRFILGLAVGPSYGVIPVYLAEVVGKSIRGSSVAILIVAQSLGNLFQYTVGPIVSLQSQNLLSIVIPTVFLMLSLSLPESPYYLVRIGRQKEAKQVLMRLKHTQDENDVEDDLEVITLCLSESPIVPYKEAIKELPLKRTKKILAIITMAIFAQHFSGVSAIIAYMETIFRDIKSNLITPKNAVILSEILAQISVLTTLTFINKIGRKKLLALSSIVCILANVLTGISFYFKENDLSNMGVAGIFLLQIGYGMGLGSIPVILMSEIMSFSLKGWFSGYYQLVQGGYVAITAKLFQILKDNLGDHYPFTMFAVSVTLSVSVLLCIVPETRNKTFQEIQHLLSDERESHEDIQLSTKCYKKSNTN